MNNVRYIEAPERIEWNGPKLFLAGGITNCHDWQKEMVFHLNDAISEYSLSVYNPRRNDFDVNDPNASFDQIKWEFRYLHLADIVSFWFPSETLCPITLYELGATLARNAERPVSKRQKIFIGCHPDYQRKTDVAIQTSLITMYGEMQVPVIHTSIDGMANSIKAHTAYLNLSHLVEKKKKNPFELIKDAFTSPNVFEPSRDSILYHL